MTVYRGSSDSLWDEVDHQILVHFSDGAPRTDAWGCPIGATHVSDYLREGRSRFALIVREVLATGHHGRVLEVGSAYGATLLALKRLGFPVTGADHPASVATYGEPLVKAGIDVAAWNIHTEDGVLPEFSFDVVICAEVLEHLQMSIRSAVTKLARLLLPGGSLILTTPNLRRLSNFAHLLSGRNIIEPFPDQPSTQNGVVVDRRAHPREPVMGELVAAMEENNLSVVHRTGFNNTTGLRGFRAVFWTLTPSSLRQHLLVRGKKGHGSRSDMSGRPCSG